MSERDDRELEIAKEDTAQIFVQFVRLHSHSAAAATVDPQSPGPPATAQATAPPASSAQEQEQHRSQLAEGCSPSSREPSVLPTLTRSKSRDAGRNLETHPKAVHSVVSPPRAMLPSRASVQLSSNQHCRAKEASSAAGNSANTVDFDCNFKTLAVASANTLSLSPPSASSSPNTVKQRPDKLTLKHKRMPSSHSTAGSDSHSESGKTTPAQDPPMDPLPFSPIDFASSSFPPMSTTADPPREGLTRSSVHTLPRPSKSVADATSQIPCSGSHEPVRECLQATTATVEGDPRAVKARMIADRLKHIGDDLEEEYIKEKLDDITEAIGDAVISNNPLQFVSYVYTQSDLSWRKVAELFKLFYRIMESAKYDDQFTLFQKVWYCLLDGVVPWIQANGGWSYYLRATAPGHPTSTPSVVRRNQPLVPAQSEPVLLDPANLPSCAANRVSLAATPNRAHVVEGRQACTPQMPRHTTTWREQSSPSLTRSQTQPQSENFVGKNRLWSLSENGSFKKEDGSGVEDTEKTISELDVTEEYMVFKEDDEGSERAFGTSQEEEEVEVMEMGGVGEEGRQLQDANRTLTSASLRSGLSLHSSSSSINNSSTSPPIVVPSPHSSSQPETVSTEDIHCDSGIENLSLSCSPLSCRVSFSVGGVNSRHSPMVHTRQQTSLTSLSSAASASPIHSPSSCRNISSNGPSGFFSSKPRPRSSGSLKESHPKQSGDSPSQCHRTGSLTGRPRPQMTTPTPTPNRVSTHSADSGHSYTFESPIPVRRMSTSAAVIYELVKDFFGSP